MSYIEIQKSLELLKKDWDVDPLIQDFMLGKISDVSDFSLKVKDVIFHIPQKSSIFDSSNNLTSLMNSLESTQYLATELFLEHEKEQMHQNFMKNLDGKHYLLTR